MSGAAALECGTVRNMNSLPTVLFVCVHNAGRSQMAAAFLERRGGGRVRVRSAGSEPADAINPVVVEAMREVGIDLRGEPTRLADDAVRAADVVVTMGCGDACPVYPGKRYEDWEIEDPAEKNLEQVRRIRDSIAARVERLATEVAAAPDMRGRGSPALSDDRSSD